MQPLVYYCDEYNQSKLSCLTIINNIKHYNRHFLYDLVYLNGTIKETDQYLTQVLLFIRICIITLGDLFCDYIHIKRFSKEEMESILKD